MEYWRNGEIEEWSIEKNITPSLHYSNHIKEIFNEQR